MPENEQKEEVTSTTLSEWVKAVKSLIFECNLFSP